MSYSYAFVPKMGTRLVVLGGFGGGRCMAGGIRTTSDQGVDGYQVREFEGFGPW